MHELQRLQQQHTHIIDLALTGLTRMQIAEKVSKTPESIGMVLKSPLVQSELARRRALLEPKVDEAIISEVTEAKKTIDEAANVAAETQVGLLSDESSRVRFSAARDILDRAMGRAQDKDQKAPMVVIDAETVNLLSVAMQESQS